MAAEKLQTRIRREQIVQAALSLVATDGLKRLSVARVARRVGIVPSALYRHFSGTDEILDAVLAAVQERLAGNVRAAREEGSSALGRLHALLCRHVAMLQEHPGLPRLVFSDDAYAGHPKRRLQMYKGIRAYLERVAEMVRQGQESGEVDRAVDPAAAALLFLGLVMPPAMLRQMSDAEPPVQARARDGWPLFERALGRR